MKVIDTKKSCVDVFESRVLGGERDFFKLWVPGRFAHGFMALSETAGVLA